MEPFYRQQDENRFESTPATAGPWSPDFQHAGPPAALLSRQIMAFEADPDLRLADMRVDILGPVPVAPLQIDVEMIRSGRSLQLLQATASAADGRPALIARAWRMRRAPEDYPHVPGKRQSADVDDFAATPPGGGDTSRQALAADGSKRSTIPGAHTGGYVSAIEWHFLAGGPGTGGPATAWGRQLVDLVAGETPGPWERTLVLADSGGGISLPVDPSRHRLINCDLHVVLDREPSGEWIRMDSQSIVTPGHGGLVHTELADTQGHIGYGMQTMVAQNV